MKKLTTLILSATLLSSSAYADKVLATFKGGQVTESELMKDFQQLFDAQPALKGKSFKDLEPQMKEVMIKAYITNKLLEQEAKTSAVLETKSFKDKLEAMKTQLAQQEIVDAYVQKNVTEAMIDKAYNDAANSLKGQEEYKASHILVATEELAKEAKKKLAKGMKFDKVAQEMSTDPASKASGGSLGYFTKGHFVPEFEKQVMSMKVGEISQPLKTQFGYHIIKLDDKRPAKVPSKAEAKAGITSQLQRQANEKFLQELTSKAEIKIIPE